VKRLLLLVIWTIIETILFLEIIFFPAIVSYLYPFLFVLGIIIALYIQVDDTKLTSSKLSWTIIVLAIPIIGLCLFIIFGHGYMSKYKKKIINDSKMSYKNIKAYQAKSNNIDANQRELISYLDNMPFSSSYLHYSGEIKIYNYGTEKFKDLFIDIENATSYIHLEYFIIKPGNLYNRLESLLFTKAEQGVEIRILCDFVGGREVTNNMIHRLKKHGIQFAFFNPLRFNAFSNLSNFRDHRKIAVIDGLITYTGGFNIADEYIDLNKYYKHWEDCHLRISDSSATLEFQTFFAQNWYYETNENLFHVKYYPEYKIIDSNKKYEKGYIYPFVDGPDTAETFIRDMFFKLITSAQSSIIISTPYLVPDTVLLDALMIQARSGLDVSIITPGLPDKKSVKLATESYYAELIKSGVKIYEYNGFIHAKKLLIDDTHAIVGTANFDMRSFILSFEVCSLLIGGQIVKDIRKTFDDNVDNAKLISYFEMKNKSLFKRIMYTVARLFAPLF
jgi:cardiolipin synthase